MRRGFTLIELMVVVGIFAILSAVLLPMFLRARAEARAEAQRTVEAPQPATPSPTLPDATALVRAADIAMKLSATHHLIGDRVFTRYEAACDATFQLDATGTGPSVVTFRFPDGTVEARDVSLTFDTREPDGVVYDRQGVTWQGMLPQPHVTAHLTFVAEGRDRLNFPLPPSKRIDRLDMRISLLGLDAASVTIPDDAFQPTEVSAGTLIWHYDNLVTDRGVGIDLPAGHTPLGQLMQLLHLVGLAVLLFGAGFWYLAELVRPGLLDGFRWGHFLLLATTYSLFFVVFAVLGMHEEIPVQVTAAAAAAVSLPLLLLHVSRVLDARFALTRVLPLALFTLAVVITGVYGGRSRDMLFITEASLAVAFVTLTWRGWATRREAWERGREADLQRRRAADARASLTTELRKMLDTPEADVVNCDGSLEGPAEIARRVLLDLRRQRDALLDSPPDPADRDRLRAGAQALAAEIPLAATRLSQVLERPTATSAHCMACGAPAPLSAFCPHCGHRQPLRLSCPDCRAPYILPHTALDAPLCCTTCGTRLPVPIEANSRID